MQINLIPLDSNNDLHIDYTYEILQKRFKHDYINVDRYTLPTKEQHKQYLAGNNYKYYYIVRFDTFDIGIIYIIRETNELGFFLHDKNAIKAYRYNRNFFHEAVEGISDGKTFIENGIFFYAKASFEALLKKHPDITQINSKVNYDNIFSKQVTEFLGFKPKTISYEYRK